MSVEGAVRWLDGLAAWLTLSKLKLAIDTAKMSVEARGAREQQEVEYRAGSPKVWYSGEAASSSSRSRTRRSRTIMSSSHKGRHIAHACSSLAACG
eukprot:10756118-Heterocapsa_arctica.AAC.1